MKYEKGTKLEHGGKQYYYMDEFDNEEEGLVLICGGGGHGLVQYLIDSEVTMIDSSTENKTIDILVDIALSLKMLNQNIDEMTGGNSNYQCECNDIDEECSNDNCSVKLN